MKKNLLLTIMCVFGLLGLVKAQNNVVTIDGTVGSYESYSSRFVPIYTNYENSISQQYYTAEEIGRTSGTVKGIAFKTNSSTWNSCSRIIDIYLVNTEEYHFGVNGKTMKQVTSEDVYFWGEKEFGVNEWVTFDLMEDFEYTGGNLLICVNDLTGTYTNGDTYFDCFVSSYEDGTAPRCAWHRNSSFPFDPTSEAVVANETSIAVPFVKLIFAEDDAVSEISNASEMNVYPNPAENSLFVETSEIIEEVSVYNLTGVMVCNEQCTMNNVQLDITDLNSGVYFVKVRTANGETVKRFVRK